MRSRIVPMLLLFVVCASTTKVCLSDRPELGRPNILWITSEDNSAHWLGCYGNQQAKTPRIDGLADSGITYLNAYANAPVCAVARSTILTGVHAVTMGTQHMRSRYPIPERFRPYVSYLREAGYYCTNNSKTDYNFKGHDASYWNDSSNSAHYRNRPADTPFFAVFNISTSHESSLFPGKIKRNRKSGMLPDTPRLDPKAIELPPLYPDLPEFRRDVAIYHDVLTAMDLQVGAVLDELDEAGLADDTIVFYYSDHGGILPRSKRYVHDTGTHIPLIVSTPDKWRQDGDPARSSRVDEPVAFVDFAPTLLSLAGIDVPKHMQGRPFLGSERQFPPNDDHVFLYADRFDETYTMWRAVANGEYRYVHNFYRHLPAASQNSYPYGIASWQAWKRRARSDDLPETLQRFWSKRQPAARLFQTSVDPWEIENLAFNAEYLGRTTQMRQALQQHMFSNRDLGLLPEPFWPELAANQPIYNYVRQADFPWMKVIGIAFAASEGHKGRFDFLKSGLEDSHPVIRYWAAVGFLGMGENAADAVLGLEQLLGDPHAANRITAAHALYLVEPSDGVVGALVAELDNEDNGPAATLAFHTMYQLGLADRIPNALLDRVRQRNHGYPARWADRLKKRK